MDLRHVWLLLSGIAAIILGFTGPLRRVAYPRNERDRAAQGSLIAFGAASVVGGLMLAGYAILA